MCVCNPEQAVVQFPSLIILAPDPDQIDQESHFGQLSPFVVSHIKIYTFSRKKAQLWKDITFFFPSTP